MMRRHYVINKKTKTNSKTKTKTKTKTEILLYKILHIKRRAHNFIAINPNFREHPFKKKIQRSIYPSNTIHPLKAPLCYISLMSFEYIINTISIVQYPTNAMLHISSWLQGWRMDGMGRMLCDLRWWKHDENKGGRPTTRERRKWVPKSGGNRPVQYYKMPRCSLTIWPFDFHHPNNKHHPPGVW